MNKKITAETSVENIQEETKTGLAAGPAQNISVMSGADSEVAGLAREQPTLESIEALYTKTLGRVDLLALPEECEVLHKDKYRFKWLAKDKNLSAKLRVGPWLLCTRVSAPFIKEHRFGIHGGVEQSGMLLAFTTEQLARVRERASQLKNKQVVEHYTENLAAKDGFYKPKDSGNESDSEEAFIEGRDF